MNELKGDFFYFFYFNQYLPLGELNKHRLVIKIHQADQKTGNKSHDEQTKNAIILISSESNR